MMPGMHYGLDLHFTAHLDAVIDIDAAVRDPARPDHWAPAFDSGDGLHLSPAGCRAMAAAVLLSLLR
jgi:lysophospholipase L1-like esterase